MKTIYNNQNRMTDLMSIESRLQKNRKREHFLILSKRNDTLLSQVVLQCKQENHSHDVGKKEYQASQVKLILLTSALLVMSVIQVLCVIYLPVLYHFSVLLPIFLTMVFFTVIILIKMMKCLLLMQEKVFNLIEKC